MSALFLLDRCNASLHSTFLQRGSPIRKCFLKENSPSDCLGGTRFFPSCWLPLSDFSPRQPEPMMILLCAFSLFYGLALAASAGFFRPQLSRQREEEGEMEGREVGRAPMDPMCENKQPATTLCPRVQHAIPSLSLSLLLSLSARLLTENRNGTVDAASDFDNLELHAFVVVIQFLLISCSRASPAELEIFCSPLSSFASSLASCVALAAEHRQN